MWNIMSIRFMAISRKKSFQFCIFEVIVRSIDIFSLGFGAPNITIAGNNAMCDLTTAAEVEAGKENSFILRINENEAIQTEQVVEWNHLSTVAEVGYICEQEGKQLYTSVHTHTANYDAFVPLFDEYLECY